MNDWDWEPDDDRRDDDDHLARTDRWLMSIAAALVIVLFAAVIAAAHDAPSGWTYPLACCSDYDCREVPAEAVEERPEGYVIVATGEVVPMTSRKVRDSPDGVFHWCSTAGRPDGKTICLFVPPRAF